jgi:hypothetical protein
MMLLLWVLLLFLSGQQQPSALAEAAQLRAEQQAEAGEIWHDLSAYPIACGGGEIISAGYAPADAFTAWMGSASHLQVILGGWDTAAVGYADGVLVVAFSATCVSTGGRT